MGSQFLNEPSNFQTKHDSFHGFHTFVRTNRARRKQIQDELFKTLFARETVVEIEGKRRFHLRPPLTPPNGGGFSAMNERYTNVNKIQTL